MESERDWLERSGRILPATLGVAVLLFAVGIVTAALDGVVATSAHHLRDVGGILMFVSLLVAAFGLLMWLALPSGRVRKPAAGREAWVCPNCFTTYVPDAHFCPHCAAPVDEFAGRAGYERIYATAWVLGKAARAPTRPLHVLGVLVLAAPAAMGAAAWAVMSMLPGAGDWLSAAAIPLMVIEGALYVGLAILAVKNLRRGRQEEPYGAPPWWTHDVDWELAPAGEATSEPPAA